MGKSSTSLIFDSPSDFRWNNIRFEVSDCPIHNLATYPHNLFVMFPFVITLPSKISNQMAFLAAAFSFRTPIKNHHLRLTKKIIFGEILWVHYPETFHVILLFETLPTYRLERAFSRLFAGIAPFADLEPD
jgi:hypothetical protein